MAATDFGGGPTTDQKRDFCSLKEGSQIPGYRGYIPQLKYSVGKTYGDDTNDLQHEYGYFHTAPRIGQMKPDPPPVKLNIPRTNGDKKYTENMVPGYTGYIPHMPFRFGHTFKQKADKCIDEFITNRDNHLGNLAELSLQSGTYPRLTPISGNPLVRDSLNLYRDRHPLQQIPMEDHRGMYESPIPGYMGFVPRINPTQIGLGKRYKYRAQQGLDIFGHEQTKAFGPQKELKPSQCGTVPIAAKDGEGGGISQKKVWQDMVTYEEYDHRIYHRAGMIPKYTGFIPQRRFAFGETFGNTTRGLEVCSHDQFNYPTYLRTLPDLPRTIVPC